MSRKPTRAECAEIDRQNCVARLLLIDLHGHMPTVAPNLYVIDPPVGTVGPVQIDCGTARGYRQHARAGEPACRQCLDAHADYKRDLNAAYRARKRAERGNAA